MEEQTAVFSSITLQIDLDVCGSFRVAASVRVVNEVPITSVNVSFIILDIPRFAVVVRVTIEVYFVASFPVGAVVEIHDGVVDGGAGAAGIETRSQGTCQAQVLIFSCCLVDHTCQDQMWR